VLQRAGGPFTTVAPIPAAPVAPTSVTAAPDGAVWLATRLVDAGRRFDQTRLIRLDPATGRVSDVDGPFLPVELAVVASVGAVPAPAATPRARIEVAARESLRVVLADHGLTGRVRLSRARR
jgi:hypothetical protein